MTALPYRLLIYLFSLSQAFCVCLGGKRLVPVGLGDDDQCIEDDFNAWYALSCSFKLILVILGISALVLLTFLSELLHITRKETLWPELDQLLRDENDVSTGTTYTAAIPEYRVEFVKPDEAAHLERNFSLANGYAVHDAQHPCR